MASGWWVGETWAPVSVPAPSGPALDGWASGADSAGRSLNWGDAGDVEREGLSGVAGAAEAAAVAVDIGRCRCAGCR